MAQINLPENSKVKKGKYFKDLTGSRNLRKILGNIKTLSMVNLGFLNPTSRDIFRLS